jgi:hypothetical protein
VLVSDDHVSSFFEEIVGVLHIDEGAQEGTIELDKVGS